MNHFDPSYGHSLSTLLEINAPEEPEGFTQFWRDSFEAMLQIKPMPSIKHTGQQVGAFELYDLTYQSTGGITIRGWVLIPISQAVNKVLIVGHGYGGCDQPNGDVPRLDCAYLYLCYRGISRSRIEGIPEDPNYHVLYNIDNRDNYIIKGCVEDTWLAVSAAEVLFPAAKEHIGFMGISFGGGIGALAVAWDKRIKKVHLHVPTFGHQALRAQLPSLGSANAVQNFSKKHPHILSTLDYYDSAIAAQYIVIPVHVAAALYDPFVAPPGQFAIYNSVVSERHLFVLEKGHAPYSNYDKEQAALLTELNVFFADM